MDASGSKIGSHVAIALHAALLLYICSSLRHAAKYPAFRNPEPKERCAALAVNLKESCAALMASALDGFAVGNPRSSNVNPVSPANMEANILRWSVCGVMDCCMNWPKVGLSPSSSFVIAISVAMVALHLSVISLSSDSPVTHFCGYEKNSAEISERFIVRIAELISDMHALLILEWPKGLLAPGL